MLIASVILASSALAGACGADQTIVQLRRPDGVKMVISADAIALGSFLQERRSRLQQESLRIEQISRATLRAETSSPFDRARARIPAFADWAYGWASNYVFSYEVLYASVKSGYVSLRAGDPVIAGIERTVQQTVETAFQRRVLDDIDFDKALNEARKEALANGVSEWRRFLAAESQAWNSFAKAHCSSGSPATEAALTIDMMDAMQGREPDALVEHMGVESSEQFALRALRPVGARVLMLALRVAEIGSIAAVPAAFGFAGAPGFFLGAALAMSAAWSVDYLINAIDAALNRAHFEQALFTRLLAEKEKTDEAIEHWLANELNRFHAPYRESLVRGG